MSTVRTDFIALIKQDYPSVKEKNIKVFDDGWDYVVCVVNNTQAFRFPRREDYAKILPREVAFLDKFSSQSPVKVPKLTLRKMSNGTPYVTYSFIPGIQFIRSVSQDYSQQELQDIAKQIGDFLTVLHTFPLKIARTLGFEELDSIKSWSDRLNKIKKDVYPHISETEQAWTTELFSDFIEMISQNPFENRLTHSDIMPEHIIVNPKTHQLSGIIDFGDMCIADPAYDFTFLRKYGLDFLNTAYESYKLDKDNAFEKRRQFYENRLVVTNLEHSIKLQDKEKIELHKKQLTDYIANR